MRFCNLICEGPGLTLLVCFTLAKSDVFCRCHGGTPARARGSSQHVLHSVAAVQTRKRLHRQTVRRHASLCASSSSIIPLPFTSLVPSARHNWEKRSNIHSIHILIDYVFSAQINCVSSWRVRSCRSNSMLYINISATHTSFLQVLED